METARKRRRVIVLCDLKSSRAAELERALSARGWLWVSFASADATCSFCGDDVRCDAILAESEDAAIELRARLSTSRGGRLTPVLGDHSGDPEALLDELRAHWE